jgi:hypothetical protein
MPFPPPAARTAQPAGELAHHARAWVRVFATGCVFAKCLVFAAWCIFAAGVLATGVAAQKPSGDDALGRLIAAETAPLAQASDPLVRGEAALVLASTGGVRWHETVLAVAKDDDARARLRGILALGFLAAPGSETTLRELLAGSATRVRPEGIAAAFALGSMPDAAAPAATTDCLARFLGSNMKRQRDVLIALLGGLGGHAPVLQQRGLLLVYDDSANRDPQVRAVLVLVMARIPATLTPARIEHALRTGGAEERRAALQACAGTIEPPASLLQLFVHHCEQDPDPQARAAALAVLTRLRHLPALEIAARAVRSGDPAEVEQATRSVLQLGGSSMRRALEAELQGLGQAQQAALLSAFQGPLDDDFAVAVQKLAGERRNPMPLRTAAGLALTQGEVHAAVPVLRDLFLDARGAASLHSLARALLQIEQPAPDLARLHDGRPEDLAEQPERLAALIAAGHPQATRFCLDQLQRRNLPPAAAAGLLRAWRLAVLPLPPAELVVLLPQALREILAPE